MGFGSSSRGFSSSGGWKRPKSELTYNQALSLAIAAQGHHRSFLGSIIHGRRAG